MEAVKPVAELSKEEAAEKLEAQTMAELVRAELLEELGRTEEAEQLFLEGGADAFNAVMCAVFCVLALYEPLTVAPSQSAAVLCCYRSLFIACPPQSPSPYPLAVHVTSRPTAMPRTDVGLT